MATNAQITFIARGLVCISAARELIDTFHNEGRKKSFSHSPSREMRAIHGGIMALSVMQSMQEDCGGISPLSVYTIVPGSDMGATTILDMACLSLFGYCHRNAVLVDDPADLVSDPCAVLFGNMVEKHLMAGLRQPASAIIMGGDPSRRLPNAERWHCLQWSEDLGVAARKVVNGFQWSDDPATGIPLRLWAYIRHELHRWIIDNIPARERQECIDISNASIGAFSRGHGLAFGPAHGEVDKDSPPEIVTPNDPRDEWLYRQDCEGRPSKEIEEDLEKLCKKYDWTPLSSWKAIRAATTRYAKRKGKDAPPIRQQKQR